MEHSNRKSDREKEIDKKESMDAYNGNDKNGPAEQAPEDAGGSGAEETSRKEQKNQK